MWSKQALWFSQRLSSCVCMDFKSCDVDFNEEISLMCSFVSSAIPVPVLGWSQLRLSRNPSTESNVSVILLVNASLSSVSAFIKCSTSPVYLGSSQWSRDFVRLGYCVTSSLRSHWMFSYSWIFKKDYVCIQIASSRLYYFSTLVIWIHACRHTSLMLIHFLWL